MNTAFVWYLYLYTSNNPGEVLQHSAKTDFPKMLTENLHNALDVLPDFIYRVFLIVIYDIFELQ